MKPLVLASISGILLSIPWLLPEAGPVMLVALVPLLFADELQVRKTENLSAIFATGYLAFFIWNLLTCWWISYVSLTGMLLITFLNSLLMATVWWGKSVVGKRLGNTSGYFALSTFWIAFEFLHQNWSLRWPWLTLGNGFAGSVKLIQWYEYTGVLGGSLWILASNILEFKAFQELKVQKPGRRLKPLLVLLAVVFLPAIWSFTLYYRFQETPDVCEIVIVQPNIDPFTGKFSGMNADSQVNRIVHLADSAATPSTDFVLAPETALPDCSEDSSLTQTPELFPVRDFLLKHPHADFIAGAVTRHRFAKTETPSETANLSRDKGYYFDLYNSALLFDTSEHVQFCHKSILVSGVERMPFQEYFSFLRKYLIDLGGASGSFAAAPEPEIFESSGKVKIGIVICFESAFGAQSAALVRKGAQILFVMTNDGWWKNSIGVRQHFNFARVRAVETRRSVVRSANTGISGFINQRGDILKETRINDTNAIEGKVNLNSRKTFYVQHKNLSGYGATLLTILILIYLIVQKLKINI